MYPFGDESSEILCIKEHHEIEQKRNLLEHLLLLVGLWYMLVSVLYSLTVCGRTFFRGYTFVTYTGVCKEYRQKTVLIAGEKKCP